VNLETLKTQLSGKRAPWIIGGLAAAAGYFWWTRRAPAIDPAAIDPATGLPWDIGSATGDLGGVPVGGGGVVNPRVPPTIPAPLDPATPADPADSADPPPPENNDQWVNRAITYLMARLFTAEFAQTALTKAQFGEPLTVAEMAAVGVAMAGLGPPPDGFPPLGAAPLPGVPGLPVPTIPNPNPGPIDPLPPIDPPVPPPAPLGKFLALTGKFIPSYQYGTSLVLDKIARDHGFPAILSNASDPKKRAVTNRTAIDRIWHAPQNAALRAKYGGDWTKLKLNDQVWVPTA
jgi:hypothetical protein